MDGIIDMLGCSPQLRTVIVLTVAGLLGGLGNLALDRRPLKLPRLRRGALELGFLGPLIVSTISAHAVDHSFSTGLVAGLCGSVTLRRIRDEIDRSIAATGGKGGVGQ